MDMTEIVPGIWIGNSRDARNAELLRKNGIKAILNCAVDLAYEMPSEFVQAKVGMVDGPGNPTRSFYIAVQVLSMLKDIGPVLVHCHEGRSRSVSVVAAYLTDKEEYSLDDAYNFIAGKRPIIDPKPAMYGLAKAYGKGIDQ